MSRLSREQKRARSAAGAVSQEGAGSGVTPIEVHVPATARDGVPGAGATVGGMPVVAGPGEPVQQAVLNYLHRLALATGHPVLATVHDERIGFVVPIRVYVDGSSEFAGEPARTGAPGGAAGPDAPLSHTAAVSGAGPAAAVPPAPPAPPGEGQRPARDRATHVLRAVETQKPDPRLPEGAVRDLNAPSAPQPQEQAPAENRMPVPDPVAPPPPGPPHIRHMAPEPTAPPPRAASTVPAQTPAPLPEAPAIRPPASPATDGAATAPQSAAASSQASASAPRPSAPRPSAAPSVGGPAPQPAPDQPPAATPTDSGAPGASTTPTDPATRVQPLGPAPAHPGVGVATFVLRAVPGEAALITTTSGPDQALPDSSEDGLPLPPGEPSAPLPRAPGTVSPPTGTFGPPPIPGAPPAPADLAEPPTWPAPAPSPVEAPEVVLSPTADVDSDVDSYSAPAWRPTPPPKTVPVAEVDGEEVKEPPVREFDSVAEAVLAPESGAVPPGGAGPIAEPLARINAAVKQGRLEEAAGLAERAVAEYTATLGTEHPDVLRLRELTAYIAYLAGDALRSFHLSLDLARIRHHLGDPRGAYGNVQSAAAAWRAVRDPIQGLHLGRDLISAWSVLAADEGPAADDLDQLERARTRMGRLAARARTADGEHPHAQ